MILLPQAERIALSLIRSHFNLSEMGDEVVLCSDKTIEREAGWVFCYNSKQFLATGEFGKMLLGNAPVLVRRQDGSALFIRGDTDVDEALAAVE